MRLAVFDCEANGFLDSVTDIWCIWIQDPISRKSVGYRLNEIDKAVRFLETFDVLIGHNVIEYDIQLIKKFYPNFKCPALFDTLILSRMVDPDRFNHGLKSYGKQLDNEKGDYGEQKEAWDAFTEEMFSYCENDVLLNVDVYHRLCEQADFDPEQPPHMPREGHQ